MKELREYLMDNVNDLQYPDEKNDEYNKEFVEDQIKIYPLVLRWVKLYILPMKQKKFNHTLTSYGMKHKCENMIGTYVWNETLKYAMMEAGFEYKGSINHIYQISNKKYNILSNLIRQCAKSGELTDFPELIKEAL